MIIDNATSRVFLGVHWIFDAFDFTGGDSGPLNPSFLPRGLAAWVLACGSHETFLRTAAAPTAHRR